jgi:phage baseplate assembly protein W
MSEIDNSFLGRGWSFPPEFPSEGAQVAMVSGDEDVRQALQILLQTVKFSRLMHPEFYCDLQDFLFLNINSQTETKIKSGIVQAILTNEHRVDVAMADIQITQHPQSPSELEITVNYTVRSTNSRANIVFPFYLQEGTNVQMYAGANA